MVIWTVLLLIDMNSFKLIAYTSQPGWYSGGIGFEAMNWLPIRPD